MASTGSTAFAWIAEVTAAERVFCMSSPRSSK
eukprot:CAMPEP_0119087840 /NCGR_PEP_ID=MMETSP1178-20130426/143266_1 /TAXON_ID=33656 /ORGANISM="unid sp, Strain CCMP2000" /LENGTH=31 /DNA_ID= /DNA_START= /DNA_END= /DNA_ORIENTATION=